MSLCNQTYQSWRFVVQRKGPRVCGWGSVRPGKCLGTASKPKRQLTGSSVRFHPVSIVLNNDNRPEPPVNRRLGFEAAPYKAEAMMIQSAVNSGAKVLYRWVSTSFDTANFSKRNLCMKSQSSVPVVKCLKWYIFRYKWCVYINGVSTWDTDVAVLTLKSSLIVMPYELRWTCYFEDIILGI